MRRNRLLTLLAALAALVLAPSSLAHGPGDETVEGTLLTWHGDTASSPVELGAGIDTSVAGVLAVSGVRRGDLDRFTGRRVRAVGRRTERAVALTSGTSISTTGSVQAATAVSGVKSVAVVLFDFADAPTVQPPSAATVRSVVFDGATSVNAYYQDASYGQLSLQGAVFGPYTIPSANTGCDWRTWGTQARNTAIAAGAPLSTYQYTVYAFPSAPACGWAGLAYMPGTESWINNAMNLRVVAHELGHNFGTHHASTLACGTAVFASSGCATSEYGDPFTVMGSASQRLHTAYARAEFGHLADTQTVAASGAFTLAPADFAAGTQPRQIRIARGDGTYLFLEFRQPHAPFDDFAASDPAVNGVLVRIDTGFNTYTQTKLLDAHPGGSFADAAFRAGESWRDPVSGATITVVSVSPAGAAVTVQLGADTQAPTTPTGLTASASGATAIRLAWNASTDNSGAIAGYRIWRGGAKVADVTSPVYTDGGLASGTTYAYTVAAFDAAGNVSPDASASATTTTQDTQPPSAATNLRAQVQRNRRVQLTWTAATDNVGVTGYRVLRNGVQIATSTTASYRDAPPTRGTYTYAVVAVDAAGNVGLPSSTVSATV